MSGAVRASRTRWRTATATALVGLGVTASATLALPAAGSETASQPAAHINIDHVEVAEDGRLSVLLAVDALGDVPVPTADDIAVSVNGRQAGAVTVDTVAAGDIVRTTVLALDASLSMRQGGRWAAAQEAAKAFLDAAPDDVQIGLLTFSGSVQEVVEPTTDHAAVAEAVDGATLTLGTNLYDAVIEAVDLSGSDGARSVLLLSDGQDEGEGSPLRDAVDAATDGGVVVDVVALEQSAGNRALLTEISAASGGDVIAADSPEALQGVFTDRAESFNQQLLLNVSPPEGIEDEASVEVAVTVAGQTYTDAVFTTLRPLENDLTVITPDAPAVGRTTLMLGAAVLAIGLAGILGVVLTGESGTSRAERQLAHYFGSAEAKHRVASARNRLPHAGGDLSMGGLRNSAVGMAGQLVKGDFETRLSMKLAGGGSALTAAEWLLLHAGIAVGAAFVGLILGGPAFMVFLLAFGVAVPWLYLRRRHSKRLSAFNGQLAETLTLMAGGLQAGLSLPQSVDTVVKEGHEPVAGEFRRALVEQRLGLPIESALDAVADRMQSTDLSWVVMAIRIQREVGGNLAELLNTVADTLRERDYLRRQVKVLSAEGRFSAWVLGGLPIALFGYLVLFRRDYAAVLWTTLPGMGMSAIAVVLLVLGFVVMSRLVKVEV